MVFRATIPNTTKLIQDRCAEMKYSASMTIPVVEKEVMIANHGALCVQRRHA